MPLLRSLSAADQDRVPELDLSALPGITVWLHGRRRLYSKGMKLRCSDGTVEEIPGCDVDDVCWTFS